MIVKRMLILIHVWEKHYSETPCVLSKAKIDDKKFSNKSETRSKEAEECLRNQSSKLEVTRSRTKLLYKLTQTESKRTTVKYCTRKMGNKPTRHETRKVCRSPPD